MSAYGLGSLYSILIIRVAGQEDLFGEAIVIATGIVHRLSNPSSNLLIGTATFLYFWCAWKELLSVCSQSEKSIERDFHPRVADHGSHLAQIA